ncbi:MULTISPECIES: hypothetical protein [Mogibacterium]|uniref:Uncharacterized protein n=1 Tax=Mogibacterium timidum TaxID=35519 RepID=A0A7Y9B0E3_9FIRM|nr:MULTISPECIES: hypothetical protein [Mogibacterium]EJU23337.1 hypothetical protein HMPREF1152_1030 [Mogibacterium sp. CM50]NWO22760.1 hypothetical protein [Mogibacterium timidum]
MRKQCIPHRLFNWQAYRPARNMDISRIQHPAAEVCDRVEKYKAVMKRIYEN